ncbi:MAG TPA: type II toxin-antitoxin system RelE/ParE family toxin, partial [Thermoanaerobaculia bacterium]|nr:type II toxin-antitoxin system RelE/ParE family toxin [Thermoanaerobaculia bacterium]
VRSLEEGQGGSRPHVSYRVELRPAAVRDLRKLEPAIRRRIASAIDQLAHTPRPPGVEKLQGQENRYRVRVGEYRVIYQIEDRVLLVLVVRVGNRRDIYRR